MTGPHSVSNFNASHQERKRVGKPTRFLFIRFNTHFFVIFWNTVSLSSFFVQKNQS